MNKKQLFTFFTLLLSIQLVAQSYVPVVFIVSDFSTNKNVNGAQVSIRQAGWATKSTGTDGKVSFDNVPVGAINFIITKDGYQLYEGEENVSAEAKSNTFRIPMTIIPTTKDKILVTGEVTDKDGRDVEGAWVEVKAANIIQNGLTDKSGNYSIEISLNTGYTVSNLAIEAKKGDCKVKQNADIPRGNVVSKDIKLDCSTTSTTEKKQDEPIKDKNKPKVYAKKTVNEIEVRVIGFEHSGSDFRVLYELENQSAVNPNKSFGLAPGWAKFQDQDGNTFKCANMKLGNVINGNVNVIQGSAVRGYLEFDVGNQKIQKVNLVSFYLDGSSLVEFYNIQIQ
ncbi:MAG: carboxypeptidase-like regulatory domain-containing protein [Saprospiraceae bacterium]|nr:carboxypeptidase-like regulatory domain-containing protein [Saprospiraceae bacterium]